MKTLLSDGRIFETKPFLSIEYNNAEPVYKYEFKTDDRVVKSSSRHEWVVWDRKMKEVVMLKMDTISMDNHELIIQGWDI